LYVNKNIKKRTDMDFRKVIAGVIIMGVGIVLLLNKLNLFDFSIFRYVISWQSALIAVGVILIFDRRSDNRMIGFVLITIGALFLLPKIFSLNVSGFIIPVIVIAIGIAIIVKSSIRRHDKAAFKQWCTESTIWNKHFKEFGNSMAVNGGGVVKKEYVFSNSKEKWTQGKLKNVEIEAVFSNVELDFTQAELADDIKVAAHIKVNSVFSGITLYVPDDWDIMIQKTGVFGGINDNRPNKVLKVVSNKLVVLELESVFGGGEIRCYE